MCFLLLSECHINGILQKGAFWVRLLSPNAMCLRFIRLVTLSRSFLCCDVIFHCATVCFPVYQSVVIFCFFFYSELFHSWKLKTIILKLRAWIQIQGISWHFFHLSKPSPTHRWVLEAHRLEVLLWDKSVIYFNSPLFTWSGCLSPFQSWKDEIWTINDCPHINFRGSLGGSSDTVWMLCPHSVWKTSTVNQTSPFVHAYLPSWGGISSHWFVCV
jgi:hypothetical protein